MLFSTPNGSHVSIIAKYSGNDPRNGSGVLKYDAENFAYRKNGRIQTKALWTPVQWCWPLMFHRLLLNTTVLRDSQCNGFNLPSDSYVPYYPNRMAPLIQDNSGDFVNLMRISRDSISQNLHPVLVLYGCAFCDPSNVVMSLWNLNKTVKAVSSCWVLISGLKWVAESFV